MRLAHYLFLHECLALVWVRCKFVKFFLGGIFFYNLELLLDATLHSVLELSLDRLRSSQHIAKLVSKSSMNRPFYSSFRLSGIFHHGLLDVMLH